MVLYVLAHLAEVPGLPQEPLHPPELEPVALPIALEAFHHATGVVGAVELAAELLGASLHIEKDAVKLLGTGYVLVLHTIDLVLETLELVRETAEALEHPQALLELL